MDRETGPVVPRRSAFAAAFFSLLLPGLGHLYVGRIGRAVAWAALPILAIALGGGLVVNPTTRLTVEGWLADPAMLFVVLVLLALDLVYRLLAMLDAWRLAQTPGSAPVLRIASVAGLGAVLLALVATHVAIALPTNELRVSFEEIMGGTIDEPAESLDPELLASFAAFTPPPTATPDPGASPADPTPSPEPTPTQGPDWTAGGELNILLVGADGGRRDYSGYLTDTMILVKIDTRTKQVAFISLPRDTQNLPIPRDWPAYGAFGGVYPYKANTIYTWAARVSPGLFPGDKKNKGFDSLKGMLAELYGLRRIDYFVAVDLRSFREVINDLGGVIVDVQNPVYDDHYPADDGSGHIKLYIPPGIQFMQGQEALAYARARHVTSDFDRAARQQRVITSVRDQIDLASLLAPGVIRDLLRTFRDSVKTDIPPDRIPALIGLAQEIDLDERISLVLDPPEFSQTCYPCPPDGLYVLKANVPRIRKAVQNVFKRDRADVERAERMKGEGAVVDVLNGTSASNLWTTRLADYLASMGVNAAVPPVNGGLADRDDYTGTTIILLNGARGEMPETVAYLEGLFETTATDAEDPDASADIVVIVGKGSPRLKP
ncbi:MAG: LCP family protein [Chloroflexota bacterium]